MHVQDELAGGVGYHASRGGISHPWPHPEIRRLRGAYQALWTTIFWRRVGSVTGLGMANFGKLSLLSLCLVLTAVMSKAQEKPLAITSPSAYRGMTGTPVRFQLVADGGRRPYSWRLENKTLPEGLRLEAASGLISGTPIVSGEFRVPVIVSDSSAPMQEARLELILAFVPAVEVNWKQQPEVRGDTIEGSVVVSNNTAQQLQFTVIVLAVNEIDKAFALGYQHFDLKPASESPLIKFGSSLPFGSYVIHVDAVAEELVRDRIYRSRLQTKDPLKLQQF